MTIPCWPQQRSRLRQADRPFTAELGIAAGSEIKNKHVGRGRPGLFCIGGQGDALPHWRLQFEGGFPPACAIVRLGEADHALQLPGPAIGLGHRDRKAAFVKNHPSKGVIVRGLQNGRTQRDRDFERWTPTEQGRIAEAEEERLPIPADLGKADVLQRTTVRIEIDPLPRILGTIP